MNYKERVEAGLCGKCGEKVESGSLCPKHREEAKDRATAKRARNRAAGTCANDNRPAVSGGKCQVCIDKAKISRAKDIARRKAAGMCVDTRCHQPAKDGRTLCQKHIDERSAVSSKHYARRKAAGTCCYCKHAPEPGDTMCADHLEQTRQQRERLKLEVMEAYGGAKCAHCDETELRFLEIDHIDGGGKQHVKEIGGGGHNLYQWLKRNNFPPGFRVLCPTCNSKAHVDRCRANGKTLTAAHEA